MSGAQAATQDVKGGPVPSDIEAKKEEAERKKAVAAARATRLEVGLQVQLRSEHRGLAVDQRARRGIAAVIRAVVADCQPRETGRTQHPQRLIAGALRPAGKVLISRQVRRSQLAVGHALA